MPNCYYYDEQRNHCKCYINENLDELLTENANLRDELDAAKHDLSLFSERIVELFFENAKMWELVRGFLYEHADYIAEGNYFIGDLDLEHAMHHNQAYFKREAKKLGVEVES